MCTSATLSRPRHYLNCAFNAEQTVDSLDSRVKHISNPMPVLLGEHELDGRIIQPCVKFQPPSICAPREIYPDFPTIAV